MAVDKIIDIDKAFKAKNPRLYRFLPGFVLWIIRRIVHQKEINIILHDLKGLEGVAFFEKYCQIKNIEVQIIGKENIPENTRCIFASNHPLGGPDGIIFSYGVGRLVKEFKFLVNDILLYLPGVKGVFLPVDVVGKKNSRENILPIDAAYNSDQQIFIFPAGMVSRKQNGVVKDLEWKKSFVSAAIKYKRDIIPVHISGRNSNFFYNLANFRKKIGIKANIEMLFLVHEFLKHKNTKFQITIGKPISYTELQNGERPQVWAERIKNITYSLVK
ncbi:MAG: 1-acyl-sn-glycerol-3-phosphate acyltransferase [Bacteroidales bacterium]|nr:1-acyl-sn-glycerol-3-phosphate acyltransferase [Bacteroidales bacterium]